MARLRLALCAALLAGGTVAVPVVAPLTAASAAGGGLQVGVAAVDATWHTGASSGQYAGEPDSVEDEWDPNVQHVKSQSAYGVQSRLSIRAIVVTDGSNPPVALVKNDNYLAQDFLTRRIGQLLADGDSGVTYENILISATHNHSSPYYSTPAAGVWVFQDVVDLRFFEYQARQTAEAIELAASRMVPAKMGATTVTFDAMKENIVKPQVADDGSPAGYPRRFGDDQVVVVRFDTLGGDPIATYVNYGEHPESLDGYQLISGDYLAPLQRFVDRETGSTMVFSQADVGSAEGPYDSSVVLPDGTPQQFAHNGWAQAERGARLLADAVISGWNQIGSGGGTVPFSTNVPVKMMTRWTPGPASHPYPSYGNCRTQPTVDGSPGVGAAPDCERAPTPPVSPLYENLRDAGLPLPANYSQTSFKAVEENFRLKLQVVRLGEVLLASCSCEAQVDLILNLESRLDKTQGNFWDGYDWSTACTPSAGAWRCTRVGESTLTVTDAAYRRMKAQVHNDAVGWDDPANAATAESDPADPADIKGNFTKSELTGALGYTLPVGLGHTGDYAGYTVSYREFMSFDSYRKSLTSYGPHTADYMNTRLVRMAGVLKGADASTLPNEPTHAIGVADEARQLAESTALGQLSSFYFDGWDAQLADDIGPAEALVQPAQSITRFQAVQFSWRGGGNYVDQPDARVERQDASGAWQPYADMSGEVQTRVDTPEAITGVVTTRAGMQEWKWTANFEAFSSPLRYGQPWQQTPAGNYRFVVNGKIHQDGATVPYTLTSQFFAVKPWDGIVTGDPSLLPSGAITGTVTQAAYPQTYTSGGFSPFGVAMKGPVCKTCTFRPWARQGTPKAVNVTVVNAGVVQRRVPAAVTAGSWVADVALAPGEIAFVEKGGATDEFGEINGVPSKGITADGAVVPAPVISSDPTAAVPEAPIGALLPLVGLAIGGTVLLRRHRRATLAA